MQRVVRPGPAPPVPDLSRTASLYAHHRLAARSSAQPHHAEQSILEPPLPVLPRRRCGWGPDIPAPQRRERRRHRRTGGVLSDRAVHLPPSLDPSLARSLSLSALSLCPSLPLPLCLPTCFPSESAFRRHPTSALDCARDPFHPSPLPPPPPPSPPPSPPTHPPTPPPARLPSFRSTARRTSSSGTP